jgi:malto-oligosyltrehalose synthase/4-alpha-glucanotransferase
MTKYNPGSTYRLQFNKDFTLKDAEKIVPYLHLLGIQTIYASPVFQAVRGSMHGYDITNPLKLNIDIGTKSTFNALINSIHKKNMGWLQDIVPNHMAYSPENKWINDVLENGKESEYYHFFDIISSHPDGKLKDKLLLPFFGKALNKLIDNHELKVEFNENGFGIRYFDNTYPLSRKAYDVLLKERNGVAIPLSISNLKLYDTRAGVWKANIKELYNLWLEKTEISQYINYCLSEVNSKPDQMKTLVNALAYLPAYWRITEHKINYRRFFTINNLICINIHDKEVFNSYHKLIKTWVENKMVNGIRVDHIDGLFNPTEYLTRLRNLCGEETYILVEKILERDEKIPDFWPVEGTTGYDFLGLVNNLLTNDNNGHIFFSYYKEWIDTTVDYRNVFYKKNRFILYSRFQGDLDNLTNECLLIESISKQGLSAKSIKLALAEFLVFCPVYKIYRAPSSFGEEEEKLVTKIITTAISENENHKDALKSIRDLFLLNNITNKATIAKIDKFFRHCMQFTGPLMAKGIEDTAYYSFNPFIGHNEVGDSPDTFGISTDTFHRYMQERQMKTPLAMNATSTHDTKRGEDARARLNVLSDIPDKWIDTTSQWREINKPLKQLNGEKKIPSANDEYFIYQELCAHLPMNGKIEASFIKRFQKYMVKALREAKVNSSWSSPDNNYEQKTLEFIRKILSPKHRFTENYLNFMKEIIPHGIINSITQSILKNTVPGVPDTFQGCETWNLSFVDPDNRQAVNFQQLSDDLDQMILEYQSDAATFAEKLMSDATNGKIKQWVTYIILQERGQHKELFLKGTYTPLQTKGKYKDHLVAFYRSYKDEHLLVILPLNTEGLPVDHKWENTRLKLPYLITYKWKNLLTGTILEARESLKVKELLDKVPFGIFKGINFQPERRAGILMHISSLPGEYGIGNFGSYAKNFIDFLNRTGQRYWQILPLTITNDLTGYSPYSSFSAFAGNILYIDPQHLVELKLLENSELIKFKTTQENKVDFVIAEKAKNHFLEKAYQAFTVSQNKNLKKRYADFLEKEKYWLNDFALFVTLKQQYYSKPWNEWPLAFRNHDTKALNIFSGKNRYEIEKISFSQFIFSEQWNQLKAYANDQGISIIGDLPIYINYDSSDVWSNPELFKLKPDKSMESVSGVPPDYFNENGQLWGMPLFNWKAMKENDYNWWLNRLRKNLEWMDLLRLDHFRGFSAYWEVPADAQTAINGKWVKGPGADLFDTIKKVFPDMPFIAEDLGNIDQEVYDLRDSYKLPGMKVIQFGFGENMSFHQHAPNNHTYNSIAYTGTHDNNTIKGWFRKEIGKSTKNRFENYTGNKLTEKNCHIDTIRITYASVARLSIIPMQDWLGLDEKSRMNYPSTTKGNWLWRLKKDQINRNIEKKIMKMVKVFGRY